MPTRPAIFLDRDGVIIEEAHYLSEPDQVRLIPGAAQAIAAWNQRGVPVVVVTNQAGVARGLFPENRVADVHRQVSKLLYPFGARVDRYYYCPHHPIHGTEPYRIACECRKPRPGMVLQAAAELYLDLGRSWLIGDKLSDLEAGARAGTRTMLVRTGHGHLVKDEELESARLRLAGITSDLAEALDVWLKCLGESEGGERPNESAHRGLRSLPRLPWRPELLSQPRLPQSSD